MHNLGYADAMNETIWPNYFCLAVWWIWRWRNCFVFNRSMDIPIDTGAFLQVWFDETRRSIANVIDDNSSNSNVREEVNVAWQPPAFGWYALNSDGAAKGAPGCNTSTILLFLK